MVELKYYLEDNRKKPTRARARNYRSIRLIEKNHEDGLDLMACQHPDMTRPIPFLGKYNDGKFR